jgi:hypothetical protein
MILCPGDKVLISQDAYDNDLVSIVLIATKGSTGTVLSYDEFIGYVDDGSQDDYSSPCGEERPTPIKKLIDEGKAYPIRFETVAPLSEECRSYWEKQGRFYVDCEAGRISVMYVEFLEKLS